MFKAHQHLVAYMRAIKLLMMNKMNWYLEQVIKHLESEDIEILEGPVKKSGAMGEIESVYFCDPDSNLIEISVYK